MLRFRNLFSQFLLSYIFRNLTYNPCCNYYYTCLRIFITKLKMVFSEVTLKFEVTKKTFCKCKVLYKFDIYIINMLVSQV